MLGKYRLKPSLLLEVAFLIGVWLVAWLVFDAPLAVLIGAIFGAYALVFLYENWLDRLSRRERAETRRSRREATGLYGGFIEPGERSLPRPSSSVKKVSGAELTPATRSIPERLAAKLHVGEAGEETSRATKETAVPVTPPEPAPSRETASFEPPRTRAEAKEKREPEPRRREEPVPVTATGSAPQPATGASSSLGGELAPEEKREAEPPKPRSLLAEIAAGPDARKAARSIGGWNVWQLERLLVSQPKPDQERDYERSLMLVYLREFADPDGQLPPEFDDLVRESFGDLVRGPAS
jgi:hypothetical protein